MASEKQAGAWAIIYCPESHSLLFGKRSLTVNKPGLWNLFGGRVDHGETPHAALMRELAEEAGLVPDGEQLIHCGSIKGADIEGMGTIAPLRELDYFFLVADRSITVTLNHEHSEYRWFKVKKLPHNMNRPTSIALHIGLIQKVLEPYR